MMYYHHPPAGYEWDEAKRREERIYAQAET